VPPVDCLANEWADIPLFLSWSSPPPLTKRALLSFNSPRPNMRTRCSRNTNINLLARPTSCDASTMLKRNFMVIISLSPDVDNLEICSLLVLFVHPLLTVVRPGRLTILILHSTGKRSVPYHVPPTARNAVLVLYSSVRAVYSCSWHRFHQPCSLWNGWRF